MKKHIKSSSILTLLAVRSPPSYSRDNTVNTLMLCWSTALRIVVEDIEAVGHEGLKEARKAKATVKALEPEALRNTKQVAQTKIIPP